MGISINMGNMSGLKQNYSYLFQGLSSGGGSNLNFLSEYASIKNGSYAKLMKAYYSESSNSSVSKIASQKTNKNSYSTSTAADSAKTLSEVESAADSLKESADALLAKGSKSVFNKVEVKSKDEHGFTHTSKEYDVNAIYKSVSSFVDDYNKLINKTEDSNTSGVRNRVNSLVGMTQANKNLLGKVGITINSDNTLSIDEEVFKASNMDTVKNIFNGNQSYGYRVSAQASLIDYAASTEASKANTYNGRGSYNNSYLSGSLYDYGF